MNEWTKCPLCHLVGGYISTRCVDMDYEEVKRRFGSLGSPRPVSNLVYDDVERLYEAFPITSPTIRASAWSAYMVCMTVYAICYWLKG